uniref:Nucleoside deaminase n=1 Tax=candidate division WOR-3 bacterium TaxID=2052148 RepID=A0A7C2PKH7_UNCW3
MKEEKLKFMKMVLEMAEKNVKEGRGGPFAAIIVKDGKIVGKGTNLVTSTNDPTAHAEIVAIREAARNLNTFNLRGAEIYTSCEPCPMCLGAIYWARIEKIYYAATREDAKHAGFDDLEFYEEICKSPEERKVEMIRLDLPEKMRPFDSWIKKEDKIPY